MLAHEDLKMSRNCYITQLILDKINFYFIELEIIINQISNLKIKEIFNFFYVNIMD
jgi:hypothetical protein